MVTRNQIASVARVLILCLCVLAATTSLYAQTDEAKAAYNEGQTAMQAKNYEAAITAYQKAIQADPQYYDAYLNLGVCYYATEKYDEAIANFTTACEKKPENTKAFINLAKVQSTMKRYPEAITSFESAVKNSTTLADTAANMTEIAKIQSKTNEHAAVIATLEKVHALNAATDETWMLMGKAYQGQQKTKDAIAAYEKSIAAKEVNYPAHFALGNIYLQSEDYANASKQYKAALEDDPKAFRAAYNYAISAEQLDPNNIDANLANWQEYIRLAKNQPKAKDDVAVATQHVKELEAAKTAKAGN